MDAVIRFYFLFSGIHSRGHGYQGSWSPGLGLSRRGLYLKNKTE